MGSIAVPGGNCWRRALASRVGFLVDDPRRHPRIVPGRLAVVAATAGAIVALSGWLRRLIWRAPRSSQGS